MDGNTPRIGPGGFAINVVTAYAPRVSPVTNAPNAPGAGWNERNIQGLIIFGNNIEIGTNDLRRS